MTLVDTSIWIAHFRHEDLWLSRLLVSNAVLGHAFVTGEVACGLMPDRSGRLRLLGELPQARVAEPDEALAFIERHRLAGVGIGYVDAHLLAAAALTPPARVWSGDKRLAAAAARLGLGVQPDA